MPLFAPFTSSGFMESIWLVGGVFSALKAFKLNRQPSPIAAKREKPTVDLAVESPVQTPLHSAASAATTVPEVPQDAPEGDLGLQILVAEDNPINRKVMQLLLRRMGYEADMAIDGEQAVEMAMAKSYDAILMDLHMPRMGGIEATEAIVARLKPAPRVVAVTADVTQKARDECLRVGMVAYLTKPVDSNLLLHELQEAEAHRAAFRCTG
ncbi:MAG: CheY-like chemotaxis protein [Rhodothermales bacterium]|jgi:CheY-like chemotaxis protein